MFRMTDLFPLFEWISVVCFLLPIASSIASPSRLYGSKCLQSYYTPPKCIDHPAGYGCDCGPGFHWNTVMCMSTAVDSRLEFKRQEPVRYTLLLSKAFPSLSQFTVVFWVKVMDSSINGTILSYKHKSNLDLLLMRSGPTLWFEIYGEGFDTGFKFIRNTWYHVSWTWEAQDGNWTLHVNGGRFYNGTNGQQKSIPSGGEFVLGQSSMREFDFDTQYAFVGDIAHLHIWSFVLTSEEINAVKNGCTLMYCGDAVQWTELRSGTRGSMRMRWPSGTVRQQCFTEEKVAITCNKYCSDLIGAQCNQQTVENIDWSRTPAVKNISIAVCPGTRKDTLGHLMGNKTEIATRPCYVTDENEGEWGKPDINNCISEPLRILKYKFQKLLFTKVVNESTILNLSRELYNHTDKNAYTNPIDVAAVIDLLEMIVNTQAEVIMLEVVEWSDGRQNYARAQEVFPTLEETKEFMEIVADIVNNLLNQKNGEGWQATQPAGTEADNLLQVMRTFARVLGRSLNYQVTDGNIKGTFGFEQAYFKLARNRIEFSVEVQWVEDFQGTLFPNKIDTTQYNIQPRYGSIEISDRLLEITNSSNLPAFVKISSLRFRGMAGILPNHDPKSTGMEAKEDNVNTQIIALLIFPVDDLDLSRNLSSLITYTLPYLDTFNISNPECVRLVHGKINGTRIKMWRWTREGCQLMRDMGKSGTCTCSSPGIFAITTDMYNDNWNKGEVRPLLMNFASYIGCASSAVLCLLTYLLHLYFRTSSNTAFLHKNLSVSIVFSQIVYMIGIDRYENMMVCHVFAVMLHYFFLTTFSWLMNEAFNLYIVITYSAHSHGGLSESGSSLRYHIIGWVIPGVLVGAFVGSQREKYYNPAMCWVSWDNIWLYIGPAAGILLVTIMVLIFTAKEHNENSYTKSEKTNKFIQNIMKALWTQVILITVFWSFAFVSLKMTDRIIKYLFGLFGFLQGVFFIVFYFLLHEEIRGIMKVIQKKQSLVIQGYNDQEDRTTDSMSASCHLLEKEPVEVVALETKARRRREFRGKKKLRRQNSEADTILGEREEEEITSDCEMITSL